MKQTILAALITLALLACNKSKPITEDKQEKARYFVRIQAVEKSGNVTYYSNTAIFKNGNGGQFAENNYGKLEYKGYSSGEYIMDLSNKQPCGIDFEVTWLGKDSTIFINGLSSKTIQLPGIAKGGEKIKAKPLYKCGSSGGDMGFIEVESPISLPVTFKSIRTEEVSDNKIRVIFDVTDLLNISVFNVQLSTDGKDYKTAAMVFPDEVQPNRQYSVTLTL